jgi:hypothetical protein
MGGIVSVALSLGSPPVAVSDCPSLCCPDFPRAYRKFTNSRRMRPISPTVANGRPLWSLCGTHATNQQSDPAIIALLQLVRVVVTPEDVVHGLVNLFVRKLVELTGDMVKAYLAELLHQFNTGIVYWP